MVLSNRGNYALMFECLFILYSSDKASTQDNYIIFKYADDTAIIGLLNDVDAQENDMKYRIEINDFVEWCNVNFLNLNVKKTN